MGKRLIPPDKGQVEEVALREALEERYLAYALSTIMNRALPDARDGLKPVHRRLLFAMRQLRLHPRAPLPYTGARRTEGARLLIEGIDEDAVDFRPTYDGSESEPVVLPGAFPNLLANGSQGIAGGRG